MTQKLTPHVATQFKTLLFKVLYDNVYIHLNGNGHCTYTYTQIKGGITVAQWLWYCATNRKVAGSIPAGVIGIFH